MTTTIDEAALAKAAGWHGKLPTLGDFATRRLPPDFVAAWDAWLSDGLAALQQRDADWLDAYLMSPSWRFLLMPGVLPGALGDTAWVGVLMPSVDRVGRYYPLTLAQPLAALPTDETGTDALWAWLLRLEEAAADAMHDDWTIDALEAELARLGQAPSCSAATIEPVLSTTTADAIADLPMTGHRHPPALFAAQARTEWAHRAHGHAYWYAQPDAQSPRLLRSNGLAGADLVARLLGSRESCPG
jgi:type VI secretion system protein ImpM